MCLQVWEPLAQMVCKNLLTFWWPLRDVPWTWFSQSLWKADVSLPWPQTSTEAEPGVGLGSVSRGCALDEAHGCGCVVEKGCVSGE